MKPLERLESTEEKHVLDSADLSLEPKLQMRIKMEHDKIEEYADNMRRKGFDEHKPIKVVIVETAVDEVFYVVDGFHRTRAADLAGIKEIPALVYRGSFTEATYMAMTSNLDHGIAADQASIRKAIECILDTKPDFGFSTKLVKSMFEDLGFSTRSVERYTKDFRDALTDERDAKIMELHGEGLSQRKIADAVGCSKTQVLNTIGGQNSPVAETDHQESTIRGHSADIIIVDDVHEEDEGYLDEDEESGPIVNPMDAILAKREEKAKEAAALAETTAMNQALQEQQAEAADTTATSDEVTIEYIDTKAAEFRALVAKHPALFSQVAVFHLKTAITDRATARTTHF